MKLLEDRVEIFTSMGSEDISGKINKFLEDNAIQIEKVMDVKLSTSPILASHDTDKRMIIVTVLIHYKIRQDVNDQE
jgi:hypothetical protein